MAITLCMQNEIPLLNNAFFLITLQIAKDAKLQKVPGKVMLVQDPRTPKSGGAAASALKLRREQGKAKIQERT